MKGKRVLTPEEVSSLFASANPREAMLLQLGLTYCTRIGEVLPFTFGDFAGKYVTITAEKNGDTEHYPVTEAIRTALTALREEYTRQGIIVTDATPLFLSRKGTHQPISPRHAIRIFQDLCARVGITERVGTHSLRKTALMRIDTLTGHNLYETRHYSRHKHVTSLQPYLDSAKENTLVHELVW